jgi:hypothetical protein
MTINQGFRIKARKRHEAGAVAVQKRAITSHHDQRSLEVIRINAGTEMGNTGTGSCRLAA